MADRAGGRAGGVGEGRGGGLPSGALYSTAPPPILGCLNDVLERSMNGGPLRRPRELGRLDVIGVVEDPRTDAPVYRVHHFLLGPLHPVRRRGLSAGGLGSRQAPPRCPLVV